MKRCSSAVPKEEKEELSEDFNIDLSDQLKTRVNNSNELAFDNALANGISGVRGALMASDKDGPQDQYETKLSSLRSQAIAVWKNIYNLL